jgi:hypothetical protein
MNAVDGELSDFWYWCDSRQRRALCALSNAHPDLAQLQWSELSTLDRMQLVRAMHALAELAVECAGALARSREALNKEGYG